MADETADPVRNGGRDGHGAEPGAPAGRPEAAMLAGQAAVFEDLQYVLRCCEHLVACSARASRIRCWSRPCGRAR